MLQELSAFETAMIAIAIILVLAILWLSWRFVNRSQEGNRRFRIFSSFSQRSRHGDDTRSG